LPKSALTAAGVERMKAPASGQVDHFDKGFPGLALRISYGGRKSWVYFYRVAGRLRRLKLGTYPALSLAEARDAWREARKELEAGRDPALAPKREKPAEDFASVAEDWLKRDQAQHKSAAEARRIIERYVLPEWSAFRIDEIGRRNVLDLIDSIVDRGKKTQALRVHARLHRLFRWAVGRGIITINPMTDLPKPAAEVKRDRTLTDHELATVWRGTEQLGFPFGDAVRLLILTGARREEIGQLRRSEIDGATIKLNGVRTKSGEPHDIPLSAPAMKLLDQAPCIDNSEFVFTTNGRSSISGWSRAKAQLDKLATIAPWRVHDLRRSVATGLQKLGTALQVTEAVLGHVSGSRAGVVGIYQRHDYADEKRAALEAWGAHVMALVDGRETGVVLPVRGKR
jgi:integrase